LKGDTEIGIKVSTRMRRSLGKHLWVSFATI
jgi:hypothetical protein